LNPKKKIPTLLRGGPVRLPVLWSKAYRRLMTQSLCFWVDRFMDRCLKFKHGVKAVVAPCKEVFKYTKNDLKTVENTSFFH
jgi:hypothetical protein